MLRRPAPKGWVHRSAFWLLLGYVLFGLLGFLPGGWGNGFQAISDLILVVLAPLAAERTAAAAASSGNITRRTRATGRCSDLAIASYSNRFP